MNLIKFLKETYCFKCSELNSTIYYKKKDDDDFSTLDEKSLNTIVLRCKEANFPISDKELIKTIRSEEFTWVNPIIDYFNNLPEWDGKNRIEELNKILNFRVGGISNEYLKRWLIALISSALNPKIINQYMLVLYGKQGAGKTTFFSRIIPEDLDEFIHFGYLNINNKDNMKLLSENLLIVIDEFDGQNNKQQAQVKALLSQNTIGMRVAYGSQNEKFDRIASFGATLNTKCFLKDKTGSRRFLVLEIIDRMDIEKLNNIDINQIYAEAYKLYNDGYPCFFYKEEEEIINSYNLAYYKNSEEEILLDKFLKIPEQGDVIEMLTSTEIIKKIMEKESDSASLDDGFKVKFGKALSKKGFKFTKAKGVKKYKVSFK